MTSYQDLFNTMDTIDPSAIHQDTIHTLFPGISTMEPAMIDHWLAEETR